MKSCPAVAAGAVAAVVLAGAASMSSSRAGPQATMASRRRVAALGILAPVMAGALAVYVIQLATLPDLGRIDVTPYNVLCTAKSSKTKPRPVSPAPFVRYPAARPC